MRSSAAPVLLVCCVTCQAAQPTTRPSVCAGTWYPEDRTALTGTVDTLLDKALPVAVDGKPRAIIVPHAGYRFSAPVAAGAYRCLRGQMYDRVVLLGFSHRFASSYRGIAVPAEWSAYQTPLGPVQIDRETIGKLLKEQGFVSRPGVDAEEHSLELQLPFLQRTIKSFALVPLLVGRMTTEDEVEAAKALRGIADDKTLLVASSDFTHFGPNYGYEPFKSDVEKRLTAQAESAAAPIMACDWDGFTGHLEKTQDTICGRGPIAVLLRVLSMQAGAKGVRAGFDTSGHLTGDWTNSVTYQSFVFTRRPGSLSEAARRELLGLARRTVESYIRHETVKPVDPQSLPADARIDGACFVTLQNKGELRGCIGNMEARGPLSEAVVQNAVNACQDPRFTENPVTPGELPQLHIEISYLTPMKRVGRIEEIIVGRHGLLISQGWNRGVLLPQVAYERGWSRGQFLQQVCRKAGLPADAWKRPDAEIYSFEAEVFGEAGPVGQTH